MARRKTTLVLRLRLRRGENSTAEINMRQWAVLPRGADYENSLRETAIANRLSIAGPRTIRNPYRHAPVSREAANRTEGDGCWQGVGPRPYLRKDIRIQEDVSDRLTDDPKIDASQIEVSVTRAEVLLQGSVLSKWARRHAEDLAEAVRGVTHVQNNLRIQAPTTSCARSIGRPEGSEKP